MLSKRHWKLTFAQELVRLTKTDNAPCGTLVAGKVADRAWSEAPQPIDPVEFARSYYAQLAVDGWPQ